MMPLDDRLSQAVADLRDDVETMEAPPFAPKRSTAPAMLALILVLGVGFALASFATRSGDDLGDVSVATQPEPADPVNEDPPSSDVMPEGESRDESETDSESDSQLDTGRSTVRTGQFTAAEAGEFLLPLPAGTAWSPDESRLLMYRTGSAGSGHFVADSSTGQTIGVMPLPFTPADIEQVYWHPLDAHVLLYTSGADIMAYDIATEQSQVVVSFDPCDRVDSGARPVPPTSGGTFSLLCHAGDETTLLVHDLDSGLSLSAPTTGDTAAIASPSGQSLVRWNNDGSASVLDASLAETGVTLDLDDNLFVLIADDEGREWAATTQFSGPAVGTVVLLPLDGVGDPVVIIGPDRGDPYPPGGTAMSAGGGVVAVSIPGADDGELEGRITVVDVNSTLVSPVDLSIPHNSADMHGYWSRPFLSVSPSGQFVAFSSDSGGDRVDTFIVAVADAKD